MIQNTIISANPISGQHLCIDMYDCDVQKIDNELYIVNLMRRAAEDAGAQILGVQSHKFLPQGVTAVLLLAESHMSIHTWPEYGFAAIDVFTCGTNMEPAKAVERIRLGIVSDNIHTTSVIRGGR